MTPMADPFVAPSGMGKRPLTEYRRKYLNLSISEARRRVKARAVEYKGGRCEKCGYNKCPAAFDFHHLDPNQKDFGIGAGAYKSFERIRAELDKTVLLCSNCHRELHDEQHREAVAAKLRTLKLEAPPKGRPRRT
jgi:hypothetical protein